MDGDAIHNWFDELEKPRVDDSTRLYRVLVADLVSLKPSTDSQIAAPEFQAHVERRGAGFWAAAPEERLQERLQKASGSEISQGPPAALLSQPGILFEYWPAVSREQELLALAANGQYDAVIAAATVIPEHCQFSEGGVRIGAGTANMASSSWVSGAAPLMNTPSFNSRATAQMVFKALLRVSPDLPLEDLDSRVTDNTFDTGYHLSDYPTYKLEGQRIAVLGYGNIGREVALLARSFGMQVAVYARQKLQLWIEAEGFEYCAKIEDAARGAQVISPHLGLGTGSDSGFANAGVLDAAVFSQLARGAVLINFDRGELVDVEGLRRALDDGQIHKVAVDADVFIEDGTPAGPLMPYLSLKSAFADRVLLLPHAAADTDHPSRVAGALQAADQLIAAIRFRCVTNIVGSAPQGYTDIGANRVIGVGSVLPAAVANLKGNEEQIRLLRSQIAVFDRWLDQPNASDCVDTPDALLALSRLTTKVRTLGLLGPGTEL